MFPNPKEFDPLVDLTLPGINHGSDSFDDEY